MTSYIGLFATAKDEKIKKCTKEIAKYLDKKSLVEKYGPKTVQQALENLSTMIDFKENR
jgi:3-keto-L-gulonate-6-phosphate decarboxylase